MKTLFIFFVFLLFASQCKPNDIVNLIKFHLRHKSNIHIQDIYKLLYQSVFGVSHILADPTKSKNFLRKEFDSVNPSENELLIEPISVDGKVVRINLRPFKAKYNDVDKLFQAMMISTQEIKGTLSKFLIVWNEFKKAVLNNELDFDRKELENFDQIIKLKNYPVLHHSEPYRSANEPAYRVVKRKIFEELFC